jgi:hypothetical protein
MDTRLCGITETTLGWRGQETGHSKFKSYLRLNSKGNLR